MDIINILKEGLEYSLQRAEEVIKDVDDNQGSSNFDKCMVMKPVTVTCKEFESILSDLDIDFEKMSGKYYKIGSSHGQGYKNTVYAKTLASSLKDEGYTTSVYYQLD